MGRLARTVQGRSGISSSWRVTCSALRELIFGSPTVNATRLWSLSRPRWNRSTSPPRRRRDRRTPESSDTRWIRGRIHTSLPFPSDHFSITVPSTTASFTAESVRWNPAPSCHGQFPTPTITSKAPQLPIPTATKLLRPAARGCRPKRVTVRVQFALAVDIVDDRHGEVEEFEDCEDETAFAAYGWAVVEV